MNDCCDICGADTSNGYFSWQGEPFSKRATKILCIYCGNTVKPIVIDNIAIAGTSSGDVYSLSEMIEDKFDAKKAAVSIKKVGQAMGLSNAILNERLKKPKKILS